MEQGRMGEERALLRQVEAAIAGDATAMDALYRRFRTSVYGCAVHIVRDAHEADDVTQQVFLKLLTSLRTYQPARGSFQGWLLRITRNAALDALRRRQAVPVAEIFTADTRVTTTRTHVREVIDAALDGLPLRQRQALLLLYVGFTPTEVARQLETSEGAVHVLSHRGRKRVLAHLAREGVLPSTQGVRTGQASPYERRGGTRPATRTGADARAGGRVVALAR